MSCSLHPLNISHSCLLLFIFRAPTLISAPNYHHLPPSTFHSNKLLTLVPTSTLLPSLFFPPCDSQLYFSDTNLILSTHLVKTLNWLLTGLRKTQVASWSGPSPTLVVFFYSWSALPSFWFLSSVCLGHAPSRDRAVARAVPAAWSHLPLPRLTALIH